MTREEDQVKEKEELKRIENEQRLTRQDDLHLKMKEQCIASLGLRLYNKIYQCLKKAKLDNIHFHTLQEQLKSIIGNDKEKMNKAFLIDQIIESEISAHYLS